MGFHDFFFFTPTPDACRSFVKENEGMYDRQVYSVLETVAVLDSSVVQALIPNLSLSLRTTEHKRGLGKNIALRWATHESHPIRHSVVITWNYF